MNIANNKRIIWLMRLFVYLRFDLPLVAETSAGESFGAMEDLEDEDYV